MEAIGALFIVLALAAILLIPFGIWKPRIAITESRVQGGLRYLLLGLILFTLGIAIFPETEEMKARRLEEERLQAEADQAKKQRAREAELAKKRNEDEADRKVKEEGDAIFKEISTGLSDSILTYTTMECREYNKDTVRYALIWKREPKGLWEIKSTTEMVAKIILQNLVKRGRNPAEEWLSLTVWAEKKEAGVTGKKMVRAYGRSVYDFNADSIEWKEASDWF